MAASTTESGNIIVASAMSLCEVVISSTSIINRPTPSDKAVHSRP
jgi:hypothetical protein